VAAVIAVVAITMMIMIMMILLLVTEAVLPEVPDLLRRGAVRGTVPIA